MRATLSAAEVPPAPADELGQPVVQTFSPRDYDADPQAWASVTDAAGFVYVGNKGCVLEYDGTAWRRIPIGHTIFVRALARGADDRLYVGGVDELGYLEADAFGRKRFVSLRAQLPEADRAFGAVWTIKTSADGVYFGAGSRVLRWHDGKFDVWRDPDLQVFQRLGGADGAVFVKIAGRPLERLAGARREEVSREPALLPTALVAAWPRGNDVTLVTAAHGVWRVRADGGAERFPTEIDALLHQPGAIGSAVGLPGGGIAFGTMTQGYVEIDAAGRFVRRLGREEGVPNPLVRVGALDRVGGLWLGTNQGIARVFVGGPRTFFGAAQGLGGASVNDIARHRGELLLGTGRGVLRLRPRDARTLTNARCEPLTPASVANVFTLASTPAGLLMAENDRVVFLRDATDRVEPVLGAPTVLDLAPSMAEPGVWWGAGGSGGGLSRFEWRDGAWRVERPFAGLKENCHTVAEDARGDLWLATPLRGVWRVEFAAPASPGAARTVARVTHFGPGNGLPDPLGSVSVLRRGNEVTFSVAGERWWFNAAAARLEPDPRAAEIPEEWRARLDGARPHAQNSLGEDGVWWMNSVDALERFDLARVAPVPPAVAVLRGVGGVPGGAWPAERVLPPEARNLTFEFAAPPTLGAVRFQTRLLGFEEAWSEPTSGHTRAYTNLSAGRYTFAVRAQEGPGAWGPEATLDFVVRPLWWATWWARLGAVLLAAGGVWLLVRWRVRALRRRNEQLQAIIAERTAELRAARDAADAANAAKSAFLAQMSHELRTPLNGILAYAQLLRREPTVPEEQRARASVIVRSGEHLLGLINGVLDLAKVEAGGVAIAESDCELGAVVAGVAELMHVRAEAKGLAFRVVLDDALPAGVRTDEQKLRQVLLNLLGNAVKFTVRGEVELIVRAVARSGASRPPFGSHAPFGVATVEFAVRDTGPGIAAEKLEQCFRPFATTAADAAAGTGLGLALSQRFVELLGSRLRVTSEVGRGSRFWFELTLPIAPRPARGDDAVSFVTGYDGPRRHVLVVDDDATSRDALGEMLRGVGFAVDAASDGAAALEHLRARAPQLVLLDLQFAAGENGAAIARRMRAEPAGASVRIVAVSASAFPSDQQEALAAGCDDFIAKPFTETTLWAAVGRALDLTWQLGRPQPLSPDGATAPLPRERLERLRALAAQGDVTGLREALEEARRSHPAQAAFLAGLQQLAATYDLERVGAHLDAALRKEAHG